MNTFIEKTMDWLLDKEEAAAKHGKINIDNINRQLAQIQEKKENYQQEVKRTLHELDHIIERLEAIKNNHSNSQPVNNGQKEGKEF